VPLQTAAWTIPQAPEEVIAIIQLYFEELKELEKLALRIVVGISIVIVEGRDIVRQLTPENLPQFRYYKYDVNAWPENAWRYEGDVRVRPTARAATLTIGTLESWLLPEWRPRSICRSAQCGV
jgi:hypothetical protein